MAVSLTEAWNEATVSAGAEIGSDGAFQNLDQCVVCILQFGNVTLSDYFDVSTSGSGTITQSDVNGSVELNSPAGNDAEQLVDLIPIDISNPFRFEFGTLDVSGSSSNWLFQIRQKTGLPTITNQAAGQAEELIRLLTRQNGTAGQVGVTYWDGSNTQRDWESGAAWSTSRPKTFSVNPTPFKLIFKGDGTNWSLILEDRAGNVLESTTPIAWGNTRNPGGDDIWLVLGDWVNNGLFGVNQIFSYMRWPTETAIDFLTAAQSCETDPFAFGESFDSDEITILLARTPLAATEIKCYVKEDAGSFGSAHNVNVTPIGGETGWFAMAAGTTYSSHTTVTLKPELNSPNTDTQLRVLSIKVKGVTIVGGGGGNVGNQVF